jgi:hypothetical protein
LASWRSGYAADCKSVYTGSIPVLASNDFKGLAGALKNCKSGFTSGFTFPVSFLFCSGHPALLVRGLFAALPPRT